MEKSTIERIYAFIHTYWSHYHYAPSHREIAEGCQVSTTTVNRCLKRLEAAGQIRRQPRTQRSVHLPTEF